MKIYSLNLTTYLKLIPVFILNHFWCIFGSKFKIITTELKKNNICDVYLIFFTGNLKRYVETC